VSLLVVVVISLLHVDVRATSNGSPGRSQKVPEGGSKNRRLVCSCLLGLFFVVVAHKKGLGSRHDQVDHRCDKPKVSHTCRIVQLSGTYGTSVDLNLPCGKSNSVLRWPGLWFRPHIIKCASCSSRICCFRVLVAFDLAS
jgi:hypothetical protein